jgi:hypothetical protein
MRRFDSGDEFAVDHNCGIDFAMRRDYAARTQSMYH